MKKSSHFGFVLQLSTSEIEALKQKKWEIDCPRMTIKSRATNSPATFYGAGLITQSAAGQFSFKLYATRKRNAQEWGWDNSLKAGEIIPDHAFYDLTATDSRGRVWEAKNLLPDFKSTAIGKTIVEGKLLELFTQGQFPPTKRGHLTYWIFSDIKIPCNANTTETKSIAKGRRKSRSGSRNAWKFRCCGIDFLLVRESDKFLSIDATADEKDFPDYFEERLLESLQFVLGRPIPWTIMRKHSRQSVKIMLASERVNSNKGRFLPPLPPTTWVSDPRTGKVTTLYHRRLFEKYLKHTLGYEKRRHPLWGQINAVYEASAGMFIDAQALTLTVAIESLLGNEFPNLGTPTKKERKNIKEAQKYIAAWDGDEKIKNRIQGSVSQFFKSRALDKMRKLAELGAITNEQWEAWQKLRNATTHSYLSTSFSSDELIDLIQKNEVLFYHLIFYAISYKGPYMDFSLSDWPLKQYPIAST